MVSFISSKLVQFGLVATLLCSFGQAFASEYQQCNGLDLTRDHVISIVENERIMQPKLPPLLPNSKIEVKKERCHYIYTESNSSPDQTRTVTIGDYGVIVDFVVGKSDKSSKSCPDVEYKKEEWAKFLAISRKLYPDLPSSPKKHTVEISRKRCLFVVDEVQVINNKRTGNSFLFDYYGDLLSVGRLGQNK